MPRNSNPAASVIAFFTAAPLDVAEVVLSLARATVAARRPQPKKKKAAPKVQLPPRDQIDPIPPVQLPHSSDAKPPRVRKPKDVALPGVVSEVGGD